MNEILCRQIAADYCCSPEDVLDHRNHFTVFRFPEDRRRFEEEKVCHLKLAVINGKLLFTGDPKMMEWCGKEYSEAGAEWFLEADNLRKLNDKLHEDGFRIKMLHPFYISESAAAIETGGHEIRWYRGGEIEQFRGDRRFDKAFSFCEEAPDVLGVSAVRDGKILGMAGASRDSMTMWQIGINVEPEARGTGIAKMLVTLLKNEILKQGRLPFYGTAFSHLASQRVALASGFTPAWVELVTSAVSGTAKY